MSETSRGTVEMVYGDYRADGSWIGFDYAHQQWIDTSPTAERDSQYPAGSAGNPLAAR